MAHAGVIFETISLIGLCVGNSTSDISEIIYPSYKSEACQGTIEDFRGDKKGFQAAQKVPPIIMIAVDGLKSLSQRRVYNITRAAQQDPLLKHVEWQFFDEKKLQEAMDCLSARSKTPIHLSDGRVVYPTTVVMGYSFGGFKLARMAEHQYELGLGLDAVIGVESRSIRGLFERDADLMVAPHVPKIFDILMGSWSNLFMKGSPLKKSHPSQAYERISVPHSDHLNLTNKQITQDAVRNILYSLPRYKTDAFAIHPTSSEISETWRKRKRR